jgi:hypothetical protein
MEFKMNVSRARKGLKALTNNLKGFFGDRWDLPDLSKLPNTPDELVDRCKAPVEMPELERVLANFGINAKVIDYYLGSSVTTFQLEIPSF